eukprot:3115262-Pyramimonas_sp.AAC.2
MHDGWLRVVRCQSLLKRVHIESKAPVKTSVQSMQHSLVVRERSKMPIPKVLVQVAESGNVQGELKPLYAEMFSVSSYWRYMYMFSHGRTVIVAYLLHNYRRTYLAPTILGMVTLARSQTIQGKPNQALKWWKAAGRAGSVEVRCL